MNLNRRLAALEKGLVTEPTVLWMPDGSIVCLSCRDDHIVGLLGVVFGGATTEQAAELDLIRRSTGSAEPGGGHLIDLIRALSLTPVEEEPAEAADRPVPSQATDRANDAEETWREDAYGNED